MDTQVRDNFSTRLCFRTSPTSSRVVLDDRAACELHDKGRAICQIPGKAQCEVMGPWVSRDDFRRALSNGGPRQDMPIVVTSKPEPSGPTADQVREVLELHAAGESKRSIERAVFGFEGGAAYRQVSEIIAGATTATATTGAQKSAQNAGNSPSTRAGSSTTGAVDWCEFCDSETGPFAACPGCGVAVCSECADGGLCPDCHEGAK